MNQSVAVQEEVVVAVVPEEIHDLREQLAVLVPSLLGRCRLGILLDGPYSPQQHVGVLYLINLQLGGNTLDEVADSLRCSEHDALKLAYLLD